jgi:hypothetical protein
MVHASMYYKICGIVAMIQVDESEEVGTMNATVHSTLYLFKLAISTQRNDLASECKDLQLRKEEVDVIKI